MVPDREAIFNATTDAVLRLSVNPERVTVDVPLSVTPSAWKDTEPELAHCTGRNAVSVNPGSIARRPLQLSSYTVLPSSNWFGYTAAS